jgi:MtN3 and saliva related transmembrane protein
MNQIEFIGFIAGGLVAISLLPQLIRSWRTRSTKDIAISWSIINLVGQILWIIYGLSINSISLIIMSAISLGMSTAMIVLKVKFK